MTGDCHAGICGSRGLQRPRPPAQTFSGVALAQTGVGAQYPEPGFAGRDGAIVAARAEGDTVVEIASTFGLSKQRVSQILIRGGSGDLGARSRNARKARQLAALDGHREQVLSAWRAGVEERVIAHDLGLRRASVAALLGNGATTVDRATRRHARFTSKSRRRFSDQELVDAVRAAVDHAGRVICQKEYAAIAKELGLPSRATIENRLGGWNTGLRAAGLVPGNAPNRVYARRWTEETCVGALRTLAAELGELPSSVRYRELARERADLPSPATVRSRVGHWSALLLLLASDPGYSTEDRGESDQPPVDMLGL